MLKAIKNAQVVLENGIIWDGVVIINDGKIVDYGRARDVMLPTLAEVIDAEGCYVGPGFVDLHVHGGGGYSTAMEGKEAAEFFLSHGATSILATTAYFSNFDEIMESIRITKENMKTVKSIKGFYHEGPFTNPKYGCCADLNPWRDEIEPEKFKAFVDESGEYAKVWAIAPERPDLLPFLEYARKVNPGTVFALAHSDATPMQIRALGRYRPTLQTHSMNATHTQQPSGGGVRGYGPDEYAFKEIDVYTELISDSYGVHVHPELQQLLLHNKGIHRVVLITDSTVFENETPEKFAHVEDINFDHNGAIAGSKLTMDLACRNIMANTNCGIAQAFVMAATTPARAIGMGDDVGSIEVGKTADLVFVDDKFNIKRVILEGEVRY